MAPGMRPSLVRRTPPLLGALLLAAALASCDSSGGGDPGCTSPLRVGLAYDVGGPDNDPFEESARQGLQRATADGLVCADNVFTNEANGTGSNREANLRALADLGVDLVIGIGFSFSEPAAGLADTYPGTHFMVVDGYASSLGVHDNVADYVFRENEGSFLVGVAAAASCNCTTVGFLGGQRSAQIGKFEAGFDAGVRAVDPQARILVEYIGNDSSAFSKPDAAEAIALGMYDAGAGIVYHASGASGAGLFRAAAEQRRWAIGVDSDQYQTVSDDERPFVLTSMIKRVDTAVHEAIAITRAGRFTPGSRVFSLADDGVGFSTSNPALTPEVVARIEEYERRIIAGEIVVPEIP